MSWFVLFIFFIYRYWTEYLQYPYNQQTNAFSSERFSCITLWIFFPPSILPVLSRLFIKKAFYLLNFFIHLLSISLFFWYICWGIFLSLSVTSTKLSLWQSYSYFILAVSCFWFFFFTAFCSYFMNTVSFLDSLRI